MQDDEMMTLNGPILRPQRVFGFFAALLLASVASAQASATAFTPDAAAQPQAAPTIAPSEPAVDFITYVETPEPRRSRALMLTGWLLFGVSYSVPAIGGAIVGTADGLHFGGKEALRLLIPVAGPLTLLGPEAGRSVPHAILISDAVAQLTGIVMGVVGVVGYLGGAPDESGDARAARAMPVFNVSVVPLQGGALMSLHATL
jgi:hypothetical protein